MRRSLSCALKKSVCSPLFAAAAAAYLILLLSTNGTVGDQKGSPSLSLFQMLMQPDKPRWLTVDEYTWYRIWDRVIHGYSHMMLVTALTAVPAVVPFCDELSTGSWRFSVPRIGRRKWAAAHWLNAVICALAAVLLAITAAAFLCAAVFPSDGAPFTERYFTACTSFGGVMRFLLSNCAYLLLLIPPAAACTLTGSAVLQNAYSAICLPLVVQFLCKQLAWRKYREDAANIRLLLLDTDTLARPEYMMPAMHTVSPAVLLPAAYLVCLAGSWLLFSRITERRLRQ